MQLFLNESTDAEKSFFPKIRPIELSSLDDDIYSYGIRCILFVSPGTPQPLSHASPPTPANEKSLHREGHFNQKESSKFSQKFKAQNTWKKKKKKFARQSKSHTVSRPRARGKVFASSGARTLRHIIHTRELVLARAFRIFQ